MVLQWFPSPGCPPLDPAASVSCGDGDGDGPSSNPGASWSILEMGHGSVLKKADGKPCDEAVPCWMVRLLRHAAKVETYPSVNRYIHGRRVQVWQGSLGSPNLQSQQQELLWWIRSPAARLAANVVQDPGAAQQVMADLRSAVNVLVLISASMAFLKLCLNMMRSLQRLNHDRRALRWPEDPKAPLRGSEVTRSAFKEAMELANSPACRLARRLPQSWVVERGTIEL
ncbi:unnamed protein product [Cladocopium goreaui]|uniref:Uncharacterized protein n=1 Tax=Cladocopium goreaui TaxID=2562237 RepID=A0A9P1G026_9DINO|nr:unnamed protein product [Cladocopium goreaui]